MTDKNHQPFKLIDYYHMYLDSIPEEKFNREDWLNEWDSTFIAAAVPNITGREYVEKHKDVIFFAPEKQDFSQQNGNLFVMRCKLNDNETED